jgi:hypothetical protein
VGPRKGGWRERTRAGPLEELRRAGAVGQKRPRRRVPGGLVEPKHGLIAAVNRCQARI